MQYLLLACQFTLGTIFTIAAAGKFIQLESFSSTLRLSHIAKNLVPIVMLLVPIIEIALALCLMLNTFILFLTFLLSVTLLTVFTTWMSWVYLRGLKLSCNCFGTNSSKIGITAILRNFMFLSIAVIGTLLSLNTYSPLPSNSIWWTITATSIVMIIILVVALNYGISSLTLSLNKVLKPYLVRTQDESK